MEEEDDDDDDYDEEEEEELTMEMMKEYQVSMRKNVN